MNPARGSSPNRLGPSFGPFQSRAVGRICLLVLGVSATGFAAAAGATQPPDYIRDLKPILEERCYSCHSRLKQKADLRLDAGALIRRGGKGGPAIVPGNSRESQLMQRITAADDADRMPPEGKPLDPAQIELFRAWIDAGAAVPPDEPIPSAPQDHWAFQPVVRPPPPAVASAERVRNPIDQFVLARLERGGQQPAPQASASRLLRRAFLDLIGIPPTLTELDRFETRAQQTGTDRALDEVVDALLDRPQYGERWARHWLDLVRYADSNGYERDAPKPFAWRYRDWVVQALNRDLSFDQFIVEQLAGDELPAAGAEARIATTMLRLGHWDDEPADPDTDRYDQLDDIVSTTAQAFLGLTLGCARCHDHKFEPLSARDYYAFTAVFNPLKRPQKGRTELTLPVGTAQQLDALVRRDQRLAELEPRRVQAKTRARNLWLQHYTNQFEPDMLAAIRLEPAQRTETQKALAAEFDKAVNAKLERAVFSFRDPSNSAGAPRAERAVGEMPAELADAFVAWAELEELIGAVRTAVPDLPEAYIWNEPPGECPPTFVLARGNPQRPGDPVEPAAPAILAGRPLPTERPAAGTSGRRLALARWIAAPDNPLTARVIVNRIWQQHFGSGLVTTPNDFGLMGELPTHPELLDWLAHWFVHDARWSLKRLHRLILTSAAWRMARVTDPADGSLNLSSSLYRRLEVEAIRDSVLAVSGQLNLTLYGPPMFPAIPAGALEANTDQHSVWTNSAPAESSRRTLYAFLKRGLIVPMLEVLDLCDTVHSSARREVTTVPSQALTLFNGDFVNEQARHFAARLRREAGTDPARQIHLAYRLALSRPPSRDESAALLRFLRAEAQSGGGSPDAALSQMCRVIFNLNEFVYPD